MFKSMHSRVSVWRRRRRSIQELRWHRAGSEVGKRYNVIQGRVRDELHPARSLLAAPRLTNLHCFVIS